MSIAVTLAMAAGMALLAIGAIATLRRLRVVTPDWTPLIWAAAILLQQASFWWRFEQAAAQVDVWTVSSLVFVAGRTIALVLAAALILPLKRLPAGETPRAYFAGRGRLALVSLAAFHFMAIAVLLVAGEWVLGEAVRLDLVLLVLAAAGFLGSQRVPGLAAGAYVLAMIWSILQPWVAP
jgi:hypothetical protein